MKGKNSFFSTTEYYSTIVGLFLLISKMLWYELAGIVDWEEKGLLIVNDEWELLEKFMTLCEEWRTFWVWQCHQGSAHWLNLSSIMVIFDKENSSVVYVGRSPMLKIGIFSTGGLLKNYPLILKISQSSLIAQKLKDGFQFEIFY